MTAEIMDYVNENVYGIWFLIGAALVFWMQAGFAMVETGFTRAKNAGNILMKNLMDFCIGTIVFILIGFGLLLGEDLLGLIGKPGFDIFTAYENFGWSNFVFNLVFCATAATIVSGAMAERTRFLSYCIYSAVISALIYPIEAHWVWGGGWLAQIGFHDFAGSACIHMVGGLCENNDKFAIDRMLPKIDIGDLIYIHDTGAHGSAMGYNYNGKLRSAEVLLCEDGSHRLIRRAETPRDYFATLDFLPAMKPLFEGYDD